MSGKRNRDTTCPEPGMVSLYRFYDAEDRLLYVGFSNEPWRRRKEHSVTQSWYPRVRHQAITWYPDEAEARRAEKIAIRAERPEFNIVGAVKPVPVLAAGPEAAPAAQSRFPNLAQNCLELAWLLLCIPVGLSTIGLVTGGPTSDLVTVDVPIVSYCGAALLLVTLAFGGASRIRRAAEWLERHYVSPFGAAK